MTYHSEFSYHFQYFQDYNQSPGPAKYSPEDLDRFLPNMQLHFDNK